MSDKKILVIVDSSSKEPQPVIERAAWLAKKTGAAIELFACHYDASVEAARAATACIPAPGTREILLLRHRRTLDEIAEPLRVQGLRVTVEVAWDFPVAEAVVRRATAERPWLVAKDTHHHTLLQRTLLTNTDWQLVRECPVPLLLVKARDIAAKPTVMAAVDPLHVHDKSAALDDTIYKLAAAWAASTNGTLHAVHVAGPTPMGVPMPADIHALLVTEHRNAMATFVETHPVPPGNVHLLHGPPHECLQRAATQLAADFVVMGALARRGIKKLLIGSTAERVLDRLPCDLVIVKTQSSIPSERRFACA